MIISIVLYGFGPVGVELNQSTGHVLSRGLFIEEVDYLEPSNFWLGPRQGHTFVNPEIKADS